jgi:predicted transposase YbfD/YdcC
VFEEWAGLQSVVMVESMRQTEQNITVEQRYFVSSLAPNSAKLAHAIRSHWKVENRLHWRLDVKFHEDACRSCSDHAPKI